MRRTCSLVVAAGVLAVSLTACGGGGPGFSGDQPDYDQAAQDRADGESDNGPPPCDSADSCDDAAAAGAAAWAASATKGVGPSALAGQLGCLDTYQDHGVPGENGAGFASCEIDGARVGLYTFDTNHARDAFIKRYHEIWTDQFVTGPNYAVGHP
jgi:hypothetical protein